MFGPRSAQHLVLVALSILSAVSADCSVESVLELNNNACGVYDSDGGGLLTFVSGTGDDCKPVEGECFSFYGPAPDYTTRSANLKAFNGIGGWKYELYYDENCNDLSFVADRPACFTPPNEDAKIMALIPRRI